MPENTSIASRITRKRRRLSSVGHSVDIVGNGCSTLIKNSQPANPDIAVPKRRRSERVAISKLRCGKECYQYSPLEPEHIRILNLLPQAPEGTADLLQCTMSHVSLDEIPSQKRIGVAFSYAWGLPTQLRRGIIVNGSRIFVRENVYHALKCQRDRVTDQRQTIWIDAICIDQSNIEERSSQVLLMEKIYQRADLVVVWLGLLEQHSDRALVASGIDNPKALKRLLLLFAIKTMLLQPWFRRTWIVQEFVLAKAVCVASGIHRVSWDEFISSATRLANDTHTLVESLDSNPEIEEKVRLAALIEDNIAQEVRYNATQDTTCLRILREITWKSGYFSPFQSLYGLLRLTIHAEVTDARDKVYGILALATESLRNSIIVDYNKSVKEVYRDAMIAMLTVEKYPAALVDFWTRKPGDLWPSWVPDFSVHTGTPLFPFLAPDEAYQHFANDDPPFVWLSVDRARLCIRGRSLGAISTTVAYNAINDAGTVAFVRLVHYTVSISINGMHDLGSLLNILIYGKPHRNKAVHLQLFDVILRLAPVPPDFEPDIVNEEDRIIQYCKNLLTLIAKTMRGGRCFFVAENRLYGVSASRAEIGDLVTVLVPGIDIPVIVRQDGSRQEFVGPASVPDFARKASEADVSQEREFVIS